VHLGIPALLDFYRAHKTDESLVLVTIIGTEGSTYRKPGAMMLISLGGQFEGMISGGCLEGDLLHHAEAVFRSGDPKFVTYDMHANDELVWGLGLGCDGIIHLMLQRLDRDQKFGFLDQLESSFSSRQAVLLALSISSAGELPPGSFALVETTGISEGEPGLRKKLEEIKEGEWPEWRYSNTEISGESDAIIINIPPRIRVLVCGAGPDAVPVAGVLSSLDWEVVIADHRPAFARPERFPDRCTVIQTRPEGLTEHINPDELDAAVIMSHHLENDSLYLRQLAERGFAYIGCLGPRVRSGRLKTMAGCPEQKVYGPVGLDIGAELPEAIALSLAAEIHAVLNNRTGFSLTSD